MTLSIQYKRNQSDVAWTVYGFPISLFVYYFAEHFTEQQRARPPHEAGLYDSSLQSGRKRTAFFHKVLASVLSTSFREDFTDKEIDVRPFDLVHDDYNWAVVTIHEGIGECRWLFFRRDDEGQYREVPVPEECQVGSDGVIKANYNNRILRAYPKGYTFQSDMEYARWPSLLVNPRLHFLRDDLAELLVPSDTNPLRGLLRTPPPARTLAHQLSGRLKEMLHELNRIR